MSHNSHNPTHEPFDDRFENGTLDRFERNQYFNGKLMTARDMGAEQRYHARRLHTLARATAGHGVVEGLDATVSGDETALTVRIEAGVAIDSYGRPVVVPQDRQVTIDDDPEVLQADRIAVFLQYDSCVRESVPVAGAGSAHEEECAYNRVLEIYDVRVERAGSGSVYGKPVPPVAFPTSAELSSVDGREAAAPEDPGLASIAASFEANAGDPDGTTVFVGVFVDDTDGGGSDEWSRDASVPHARVYSNDMLYAATARHATDFRNPHEVTLGIAERETGDGASVHVVDDEREAAAIDLASTDGTVAVDLEGRTVDLSVEAYVEAKIAEVVHTVGGVDPDQGGNVALESDDDTVNITRSPAGSDHTIDLSVSTLLDRIENLEKTVADLESRLGEWQPRFELGEYVVDGDAEDDPDPAVVIAELDVPISDWTVYQDESVAAQNPTYREQESVAIVAFEHLLEEGWEDWNEANSDDLFEGVIDRGIKFHAFPRTRLERLDSDDA